MKLIVVGMRGGSLFERKASEARRCATPPATDRVECKAQAGSIQQGRLIGVVGSLSRG
jgi:hypothetical protein